MKGYNTNEGYMGLVGDDWVLFSSEDDYIEYMKGDDDEGQ